MVVVLKDIVKQDNVKLGKRKAELFPGYFLNRQEDGLLKSRVSPGQLKMLHCSCHFTQNTSRRCTR